MLQSARALYRQPYILTHTTCLLIASMGLGPGGAVKHRLSLSFMNSPHRWTKVYPNGHDYFRFLKSLRSSSPPSPPTESSTCEIRGNTHTCIEDQAILLNDLVKLVE